MKLSVIVVTWNRAQMLERLFRALGAQTLPLADWDLLVVLDACTDESAHVCEEAAVVLPNLRVITQPDRRGQVHGLNAAFRVAEGEVLAFTDDDCIPEPDWLQHMSEALSEHALVSGAIRSPERPYWLFCHNIAQCHAFFPERQGTPTIFAAGTNFGCRRSWLASMDGFDVSATKSFAPDMAITLKAMQQGQFAHFAPRAIVCHAPDRTTFLSVMRYAAKHSRQTILLRGTFANVLRTPCVLRSPVLLALASPVIALQVTLHIYLRNPALRRRLDTLPAVLLIKFAWCYGAVMGLLGR